MLFSLVCLFFFVIPDKKRKKQSKSDMRVVFLIFVLGALKTQRMDVGNGHPQKQGKNNNSLCFAGESRCYFLSLS